MKPALACAATIAIMGFTLLGIRAALSAEPMACTDRKSVFKTLQETYAETPIGFGLNAHGDLDVVTVNQHTGTWSAVLVKPNGQACILTVGVSWQMATPPSSGDPS